MKSGFEIIIRAGGLVLSHSRGDVVEELDQLDSGGGVGEALVAFADRHGIVSQTVNLFLAEELVYVTEINLPLSTPSISEAVSFQLGILLPFAEEDVLYSYSTIRRGDGFKVVVCAARPQQALAVVEELIEAGFVVKGLYPESQRYVTGRTRKGKWALVMPGRQSKVCIFEGGKLVDRLLCAGGALSHSGLEELCGTREIFHMTPPVASGFSSVRQLMSDKPLLKDHNMLPDIYRRPDYLKMLIIILLVLNIVGLVVLWSFDFISQGREIGKSAEEISRLKPVVKEVNETREQIALAREFLAQAAGIGGNIAIMPFMKKLTESLPEDSYLDQLKMDAATRTVTINGYTDDVGALTEKMQEVGESKLKSTSRRKNRVYFQMEISLP